MLRCVFTSRCWFRNYQYSEEWDKALQVLILDGDIESIDSYTVTFRNGGTYTEVWISNQYYAYGHSWGRYMVALQTGLPVTKVLPSRITAFALADRVKHHREITDALLDPMNNVSKLNKAEKLFQAFHKLFDRQ